MQTICITGGTGFIGSYLTHFLAGKGYRVVVFSRRKDVQYSSLNIVHSYWDPETGICDTNYIAQADAIINLAGENIAGKRWTKKRKQEIEHSRIHSTDFLVAQINKYAKNELVFISTSAIGIYGADKSDKPFTETDLPANDFLGHVCSKWEQSALNANQKFRTVILRLGIVVGRDGGVYKEFEKMISWHIKPIVYPEHLAMSWITIDDLARMMLFAIDTNTVHGIYNAVSPNCTTYRKFINCIAASKNRFTIPAPISPFLMRIFMGELGAELFKSCSVSARKIVDAGFRFEHAEINSIK